jgi:hypothetical protein
MASGHRSTDPNGAGGQKAPGLQSPQGRHQGSITTRPGVKQKSTLRGEEAMGAPGTTTAVGDPPQR